MARIIVISGPSGVGKSTICKELCKNKKIQLVVSDTTRGRKEGEIDGVEYNFVNLETFKTRCKSDYYLEYDNHHGEFYGTPVKAVLNNLDNDIDRDIITLLEVDVNGGRKIKSIFGTNAKLFFIVPPNLKTIKSRLINRGRENKKEIKERMARCEYEYEQSRYYDHIIENGILSETVDKIFELLEEE